MQNEQAMNYYIDLPKMFGQDGQSKQCWPR